MGPKLKKKTYSPKQRTKPNFALGCQGEDIGANFLQKNNFEILERNFVGAGGCELDLIVLDHNIQPPELVFVEIKTRARIDFGDPTQAINSYKLHQLQKAASSFLTHNSYHLSLDNIDYRFDSLAIIFNPKFPSQDPQISHYQNITW